MRTMQRQQGVALMIVLMIVALVSVLATEMGSRLQLQVQRTINIKDNNQAYWYAMGAEAFARKSIVTLMEETGDKITLNQPWAQEFTYPVDGGGINARLEDIQSCFNLNALAVEGDEVSNNAQQVTPAMEAFHRMLLALETTIDSYTADTVRDSLADWLDSDDMMRPYGAEDSEYESREHPYLAANSLMTAQSELRLINGVDAPLMSLLEPLVCVVPEVSTLTINVNTLAPERAAVLAGVTGLTLQQATNMLSSRPQDGWDDANAFLAEPMIEALNMTQEQRDWIAVTTEYFILHTKTRYNKASFSMSTLFKATESGDVSVLRREFGGVD